MDRSFAFVILKNLGVIWFENVVRLAVESAHIWRESGSAMIPACQFSKSALYAKIVKSVMERDAW